MTFGEGIALLFAALWLLGWGFTIRDTPSLDETLPRHIAWWAGLFFFWPCVAWKMTN